MSAWGGITAAEAAANLAATLGIRTTASLADSYCNWDLIRCSPSCQPTRRPWRLDPYGWRFKRCDGCRTLWVWDGHWREALSPAALARLEAEVLNDGRPPQQPG